MERNPTILGLVAAAVIAVGTVAALSVQGGLLRGGYELTVEFADAAGLRAGDDVFVAGVRAGQVSSLAITGDHVEATLRMDDVALPVETRASIALRTLVGRRAVELDARGDWARQLADGDRIPLTRTSLPTDVPEFGDVAERLLSDVDSDALNTLLVSLTDVTRGQRAQIEALVAGGNRLTGVVNDQEQEIRVLLDRLRAVSETLASRDEELVRIVDDFGATVATLAEHREDVRRLLRETNRTSGTAADLVAAQRGDLDRILAEVHEITAILSRHQLDLAEALAYSGDSVGGFASITMAGGTPVPWGQVFVTSLGPAGVDVLLGCQGFLDRQLDEILGPDPRSCEELENETLPPDARRPGGEGPPVVTAPLAEPSGQHAQARRVAPERLPVDAVARRLLAPDAQGRR